MSSAPSTEHLTGVLTARLHGGAASHRPGLHQLDLGSGRDSLLLTPEQPHAPLIVALHGAGGDARQMLNLLAPECRTRGIAMLAVASLNATWDVIRGGYGVDVRNIDEALARVAGFAVVDSQRLAIGGFSDGASYALSLGLINGDLFSNVIAFSPGFVAPGTPKGRPHLFISHGVRDEILPIDRCSRRLVPALHKAAYAIDYYEFDGGHAVPPEAVQRGLSHIVAH